jgi:hypothetical protein
MLRIELNLLPGMRNVNNDVMWREYEAVLIFGRITTSQ